jgi:acyl-CoA hydrolase
VTGNNKTLHPGKVVITFALGSEELYNYIDNNPFIEAHPVDYVNDPFIVSQNDNLVAINSAIEVDLTGQVCSDSIGSYIYSGFGGQVDFIRGAARSKGGKPIIALPATAKGGKISRIVPLLKEGSGVVTSRADVHYVVTEFGVANLFGKNLRERAEALIGIADHAFHDELHRAAKERKLLP